MKTDIELAKQVSDEGYAPVLLHPEVRRLCELVRAEEREECAKVCERDDSIRCLAAAQAIRARGEA